MKNKTILAAAVTAVLLAGCSEAPAQEKSAAETGAVSTTVTETTEPTESSPEEAPEEQEELYDTTPISQAYLTGDASGLDELQKEIYDRAVKVLDENVTDGMDDYAKELAVHDYIVQNVTYDIDMLSVFETHGEHASDPYGALVDGRCICSGYTTTFKMFMDMLEIPCTCTQAGDADGEDHAWNMVQINGHWYYMDVTWDDPVPDVNGRPEQHKYFNTSKEVMASRHVWDSSSDPVCDSTEDSFVAHNLVKVESPDEIKDILSSAVDNRCMNVYIDIGKRDGWELESPEEVDAYLMPGYVSEELDEICKEFCKSIDDKYGVYWQRMEFDGRIILAGYLL